MSLHMESLGSPTQPSLVLLHGWGMHGGVWQPVLNELSQHFHLHLVDLPGMGYSAPLPSSTTSDSLIDAAMQPIGPQQHRYMEALVSVLLPQLPAQANICGWSFGGQVAMQLALQHPSAVNKLVLVGCTPKFVHGDDDGWPSGMQAAVFQKFAASVGQDYQSTLLKFLTLQCMGASDARHTVKLLRASFLERPEPDAASLRLGLNSLLENDFRARTAQLSQPVLIVHGDRDTLAPVAAAHWLAEHLPQARSEIFAGASHAPFLSHPQQFNAALIQFLL